MSARLRLGIYTDYVYRRDDGGVWGERAFVLFQCALRPSVDDLTLLGRLAPEPGRSHYRLPDDVRFVGLPHHESLTRPHEAVLGLLRSLRHFWRALDELDAVWLLGPYIHSIAYLVLARARRRKVVLGVRQDLPAYTRNRHPDRPLLIGAARALEATWRLLARRWPIVVVGPDLARGYAAARDVLPIAVSLIREADIADRPPPRLDEDRPLTMLSVGRVDREKNPLLLADALALVRREDPRWRLVVCGDGPMREELGARLAELGVAEHAELLGYVAHDDGLADVYRSADLFLHVSWTEGLPQVLFEAFAAARPVVATAVGGVPDAVGDAAVLVGPGDPEAAAAAVLRLAGDPALVAELVERGTGRVREQTMEREAGRTAAFIHRWAGADS